MQPRHLSTHKIASKSVNNFFTYHAEMQKSSANLVPKSGICSGSGSEVNQLVDICWHATFHPNPSMHFRVILLTDIDKPEGHSVQRMYLQQRLSDGSVNKTIWKSRLTAAPGRRYVYVGLSRRKFRIAALIGYRRKQSASRIQTII